MNKITVLLFVVFLSIFISDVNANTTKIKFSDNVIEEVNTLNILKADKILELVLKIDINVPESKILELSKYDVKIKKRIENILVIEIPSKNIDKLNKINWITFIRKSSHIIENCVDLNDKNINNNIYTKKKSLNKGKNVKIAIIDTGFKLENSSFSKKVKDYYCFECPRKVFSDGTQDLTNKENWIHGNAVAEIINKISPSADLYLLAVAKDPLDILTAIEHSVKYYKPDIISISINDSYPYDFFDGSGLYGKRIKNIVKKNNVILVSAGGNNVKNHL
jgi:hypothetical protein